MVQMQGATSATPPRLCSFLSARAPLATSPLFPGTGTPGALIPFTFPPPFLEEAPRIPQHPEMLQMSAPCTPQCVLPALSPHALQTPALCTGWRCHGCTRHVPLQKPPRVPGPCVNPLPTICSKLPCPHPLLAHVFQVLDTGPLPSERAPRMRVHLPPRPTPHAHASAAPHVRSRCPARSHCPRHARRSAQFSTTCTHSTPVHTCSDPNMLQVLCMRALLPHTYGHMSVNHVLCPFACPQFGGNGNGQRDAASRGLGHADCCGDGYQ